MSKNSYTAYYKMDGKRHYVSRRTKADALAFARKQAANFKEFAKFDGRYYYVEVFQNNDSIYRREF